MKKNLKWITVAGSLILLGGGTAGATIAFVNQNKNNKTNKIDISNIQNLNLKLKGLEDKNPDTIIDAFLKNNNIKDLKKEDLQVNVNNDKATIKVVKSEMYTGHVEVKVLTIKENIQIVHSIWNEGFFGKLIRPIYFENLFKELNKRLRQKDADEILLASDISPFENIGNSNEIKLLYKENSITLKFGKDENDWLDLEKEPTYNEDDETICLDMGWKLKTFLDEGTQHYIISPQTLKNTVKEVPTELPWFVNGLDQVFLGNENEEIKGIEQWDASNFQYLNETFANAKSFNQDLEKWDVSNVIYMNGVFSNAESFNKPLNGWDVSNVHSMWGLFFGAKSFNQDLEKWDVSNVAVMDGMFGNTDVFNKPLNNWNTSKLTEMNTIFFGAKSFNQDLDKWDVSNVTTMVGAFSGTESFNGNISTWNLKNLDNMSHMFEGAKSFNQDISTRKIPTLDGSEYKAWDTSNVSYMNNVFANAELFDQNISNWDVKKVVENNNKAKDDEGNPIPSFSNFSAGSKLSPEKLPKFNQN
ncbi:BspA family leucine-rich repeat surface protein [Mycoplasma cottewii]|uniref:BspA family leucine-rich repeat surface protein n=1 Tax=Mycoplasma cottewii TaxID=51364 RepID=A0ABY5TWF5_9MOLU|nr:BspA family leucine-rich repeat surface protein [Mycoplasma cottewii]UWD35013.1 BspA family leucine-rich repeat surface protein [Mycoplasma cottewii]